MFAFGALATFVFLAEPLPVDPFIYLEAAQAPSLADPNHWTTRLGIVLPTWFVSLAFGFSEVSYYLYPIAMTGLFGVATMSLARHFMGRPAAFVAGALAVVSPFVLPYGSQLLPDIGAAALLTLASSFVFKAAFDDEGNSSRTLLFAGVLFGIAYLTRETSLLWLPAGALMCLVLGLGWKKLVWMALGAVTAPVAESALGALLWSDPLARVNSVVARSASDESITAGAELLARAAQSNPIKSFYVLIDLLRRSAYGWISLVGGAGLVALTLRNRRRDHVALVVWLLVPWTALALFGTIYSEESRVSIRLVLDRYWAPFAPVLAIAMVLTGIWVARAARRIDRRVLVAAGLGVAGAILAAGLLASYERRSDWYMWFGNDGYWQLRDTLEQVEGSSVVYVPPRVDSLVRLYTSDPWGRSVSGAEIRGVPGSGASDDAWLLFNSDVQGAEPSPSVVIVATPDPATRLHGAEAPSPRWVLRAPPESGGWAAVQLLVVGESGDAPWNTRSVIDGEWTEVLPLENPKVLAEGEQALFFDSSAGYGEESDLIFVGQGVVEVRHTLQVDSGPIAVTCQFFDVESDERTDVAAQTMVVRAPSEGDHVSYCRTPGFGVWSLRSVLRLWGPATVNVTNAVLTFHPEPTSEEVP